MSTPIEQFSRLTLQDDSTDDSTDQSGSEEMSFDTTPLEKRKIIVRDVLVSFKPHELPSEFRPVAFQRITQHQGQRPSRDWTLPDDLEASLMIWCCHDRDGWAFIKRMQRSSARASRFQQKVERRLLAEFDAYDKLADSASQGTPGQIRGMVLRICDEIQKLVKEIETDVENRAAPYNAARTLLNTLATVCDRNDDVSYTRRSGRSSQEPASTDTVPSMYEELIRNATTPFVLDALEAVQAKWPRYLSTRAAQNMMGNIRDELVENRAPQQYIGRFQTFLT